MKEFLLEGLLYPFLAILFCLAFGVPFTYTGFQNIHLTGEKDASGQVSMDLSREHYFGLYTVEEHVENVVKAQIITSRPRKIGGRRLVSGVYLVTAADEHIRLMAGSSSTDYSTKREMVLAVKDFVESPTQTQFDQSFHIQNLFGWFGLPFLILGVLGLIGWPGSIIKKLKD